MKKILMLIMALVLVIGVSGQAMAYFDGELIRAVYHEGGTLEQITALGPLSSHTTPFTDNVLYSANPFALSTFVGAEFADLQVAYFIFEGSGTTKAWTSGPLDGTQTSGNRQGGGFKTMGDYITTLLYNTGGDSDSVVLQSNPQAYSFIANANGVTQGKFNSFIPGANGEANLAVLGASSDSYVDQSLYYYSSNNIVQNGVNIATIRTWANGTTELNPSSVPVPAAVYLLGSGLLGLVGIRRKMAA
ncbi:MAG: VPLPA-CTERM sorting domain-containing protein [Nitrospiraceae bacterium]|nr:MAG: VPLPA-CTERM sorting domain-containing protein [Nitrospiraceae bacterium]